MIVFYCEIGSLLFKKNTFTVQMYTRRYKIYNEHHPLTNLLPALKRQRKPLKGKQYLVFHYSKIGIKIKKNIYIHLRTHPIFQTFCMIMEYNIWKMNETT